MIGDAAVEAQPNALQRELGLTQTTFAVRAISDPRRSEGRAAFLGAKTVTLEQRHHVRGRERIHEW
jgi:hypothetical protein